MHGLPLAYNKRQAGRREKTRTVSTQRSPSVLSMLLATFAQKTHLVGISVHFLQLIQHHWDKCPKKDHHRAPAQHAAPKLSPRLPSYPKEPIAFVTCSPKPSSQNGNSTTYPRQWAKTDTHPNIPGYGDSPGVINEPSNLSMSPTNNQRSTNQKPNAKSLQALVVDSAQWRRREENAMKWWDGDVVDMDPTEDSEFFSVVNEKERLQGRGALTTQSWRERKREDPQERALLLCVTVPVMENMMKPSRARSIVKRESEVLLYPGVPPQ